MEQAYPKDEFLVMFTDTPVTDYRTCQSINIGKWFTYRVASRGIIPFGTAPDERWTISVQYSEEDIEKHLKAYDGSAELIRATTEGLPSVRLGRPANTGNLARQFPLMGTNGRRSINL